MAKARALVGLDVHASMIVAAVLDADTGELEVFVMNAFDPALGELAGERVSGRPPMVRA